VFTQASQGTEPKPTEVMGVSPMPPTFLDHKTYINIFKHK